MASENKPSKRPEYMEIDDEAVKGSINSGVMSDELSMSRIVGWSVITSVIIVLLIVIAFNLYQTYKFERQFQKAIDAEYSTLQEHRAEASRQLNTTTAAESDEEKANITIDDAKGIIIQKYN